MTTDCDRRSCRRATGGLEVAVGGIPFFVRSAAGLSGDERGVVDRLSLESCQKHDETVPFQLEVVHQPPWATEVERPPSGEPAAVSASGGTLQIRHHDFFASLDVPDGRGTLIRETSLGFPLEISLRTAMCACLPRSNGVALHAAGLLVNGAGVVFFGPSGAGKTTLAMASPFQVLSDELVAVTGSPWQLRSTGFWGEMREEPENRKRGARLSALVELVKADEFFLKPVRSSDALRKLVQVLVLPLVPTLWNSGIQVLVEIVEQVPVWRMGWSPASPPWTELQAFVRNQGVGP